MNSSTKLKIQENQQAFFIENGYLEPLFSSDVSDQVSKISQELEKSQQLFKGLPYKIINDRLCSRQHHIFSRLGYNLAISPSMIEVISHLLGPDLLLWAAHFYPRKHGDTGQSWHRDEINYWCDGVHVSVAISDMNLSNGCLQVIPKTHQYQFSNLEIESMAKKEKLDLHNSQDIALLADKLHPENAPHQVVSLEMQSGEYFFTKGGLWHGVVPNQSNDYRLGFFARYMRPDIKSSAPCILVRGNDNYSKNCLYRPPCHTLENNLLLNSIINMMTSPRNLSLSYQNIR